MTTIYISAYVTIDGENSDSTARSLAAAIDAGQVDGAMLTLLRSQVLPGGGEVVKVDAHTDEIHRAAV